MRTSKRGKVGVGSTGATAATPRIDIGAAHIVTGGPGETRRCKRAVGRLAAQEAGVARSSDSHRADVCGQDLCRRLARALHRILGRLRRSAMVVSDRLRSEERRVGKERGSWWSA